MVPLIVQVCLGVLYGLSGLTFIDHKAEPIFHILFERPESLSKTLILSRKCIYLFIIFVCMLLLNLNQTKKTQTNSRKYFIET